MSDKIATREKWLMDATSQLRREWFKPQGLIVPDSVRLSVGFPFKGGRKGSRAIGQCWGSEASADGRIQIFICPTLSAFTDILPVLIHELCHATVGVAAKHGAVFKRAATTVGLEGKMTETVAGPALRDTILEWSSEWPPYPHAELRLGDSPIKKQGTRMLKITCPNCGYAARTTSKWLEVGLPTCPCGAIMQAGDGEEEGV